MAQVAAVGGHNALGYPEGLNPSAHGGRQAAIDADDDADTTGTETATARSMGRRSMRQFAGAVAALPDRSAQWADIMEAEEAGSPTWDPAGSDLYEGSAAGTGGEAAPGAADG